MRLLDTNAEMIASVFDKLDENWRGLIKEIPGEDDMVFEYASSGGKRTYKIMLRQEEAQWLGSCTCPWGSRNHDGAMAPCKHIGAALLLSGFAGREDAGLDMPKEPSPRVEMVEESPCLLEAGKKAGGAVKEKQWIAQSIPGGEMDKSGLTEKPIQVIAKKGAAHELSLVEKLAQVMAEVGYVQKDAVNEFHRYRYASAEAVLKKVNSALSSRGIAVSSTMQLLSNERIQGGEGKALKTQSVVLATLAFTDGKESLSVQGLGCGEDTGDKAVMKANTAAIKYAVAGAFLISWGDDPEAEHPDEQENFDTTASWVTKCEEMAKSLSLDEYKKWWPENKPQILEVCGEVGAAKIYAAFLGFLKEMKA